MKYFVPAWHDQYIDWSLNIPTIENYDSSDYMNILKKANEEVGLIITDYQPQYVSKLNQTSYSPDSIFSIFDYLQGVHGFESKVLEVDDFNWPKNMTNVYKDFNSLIYLRDKQHAVVSYDIDGHILKIIFFETEDHSEYTLLIDSRGFVSAKEDQQEIIYYDPFENWRFKQNKASGKVYVNPEVHISKKDEYDNINELIDEILLDYIKNQLKSDDQLIMTIDDESKFSQKKLIPYNPIYVVNQHHTYNNNLEEIASGDLVVGTENIKKEIEKKYGNRFNCTVIPIANSEFRLGHSLRQKTKEIAFFAENASKEENTAIIQKLADYLIHCSEKVSLKIYTYDYWKNIEINNILEQIQSENKDRFIIGEQEHAENKMIDDLDENIVPLLDIKSIRLTNLSDVFSNLDSARLLLNWGRSDALIQISGISVGIPQIQNFESPTVLNEKNGRIISQIDQIVPTINEYLTNLEVWNSSLVYNVQIMEQYSDEKIVQKWNQVFEKRRKTK